MTWIFTSNVDGLTGKQRWQVNEEREYGMGSRWKTFDPCHRLIDGNNIVFFFGFFIYIYFMTRS